MKHPYSSTSQFLVFCLLWVLCGSWLQALELTVDRPKEREFVRDLANMIDAGDEEKIRQLCDKLLTDKATPIIVVTIDSMAEYGGEGLRIETFATLLFDQWGIGHARLNGQNWNTGILLLVSKGDRKARIELGAGWGHSEDQQCQKIMDDYIIRNFKKGRFSEGIVAGVEALDKMARKLALPGKPRSKGNLPFMVSLIVLAVFTVVSIVRRGVDGWAWMFWGAIFSVIAFILTALITSNRSGGGGGFSGGSFGGGFSGGGGASGSW